MNEQDFNKPTMPLEGSYAVWNNRGGSGKTTLTYHLANKYASKNPDKTILLIDMCPQADLSHAFLGDDDRGHDYVSQFCSLKKDPMLVGDQRVAKTVSGYLDLATSINFANLSIDPRTFLINVSKFNSQLARNLYLLCGDPSLELVTHSLEQKRDQHFSLSQYGLHAWKSVTTVLQQFIRRIAERKGIKLVVFIDMNSTFSILTEIALAASDKLIIPITDEHMRRNNFEYLFALLYGFSQPSNVYYYYRHFSFYFRAKQHDVKLPRIHLIINKHPINSGSSGLSGNYLSLTNRSSNNNEPKKAALNEAQWQLIFDLFKKHPEAFNLQNRQSPPETLADFKKKFVMDICERITSNKLIRQSIRSHSPLMHNKRPRTASQTTSFSHTGLCNSRDCSCTQSQINYNNNNIACKLSNGLVSTSLNSKSSYQLNNRSSSPTQTHLFTAVVPRSVSSSNRPFSLKNKIAKTLSRSSRNLASESPASAVNFTSTNYSDTNYQGYGNGDVRRESLLAVEANNLNHGDNEANSEEQSNAILYDNILDKIVEGLDEQKY